MLKQCDCSGWKEQVILNGTRCRWCAKDLKIEDPDPLFEIGTKLQWKDCLGVVINNIKLPGDICIAWDTLQWSSYDREFLKELIDEGSLKIIS